MEGRNPAESTEGQEQIVYFVQPNAGTYFKENLLSKLFDNLAKISLKPDHPPLFTKLEDALETKTKLTVGFVKASIPHHYLTKTGDNVRLREAIQINRHNFLGVYFLNVWSRNISVSPENNTATLDPENSNKLFDFYKNEAGPLKNEITEDIVRERFNHVLQTLRILHLPTAQTHIYDLPPELTDYLYEEHMKDSFEYPEGMKISAEIIKEARTAFISQEVLKAELETWKKLGTRGLPEGINKMYELLETEAKKAPGTRIKARDLAQRLGKIAKEQAASNSRGRNLITQKFYTAIASNNPELLLEVINDLNAYKAEHQTNKSLFTRFFNVISSPNESTSGSQNENAGPKKTSKRK